MYLFEQFLRLLLDACDVKGSDVVENVFGGKIRTGVTCCECHKSSGVVDPIQDLSLEIDCNEVDSVSSAVEKVNAYLYVFVE